LALEHDPEWYERVATVLRRFSIKGVELVLAPLRSYGEFASYDAQPIECRNGLASLSATVRLKGRQRGTAMVFCR
jgi:ribosomal protein S19E (S16A)